ncbi:MAG: hypothetical protein ACRD19_05965 [Terriglobia bacterium]
MRYLIAGLLTALLANAQTMPSPPHVTVRTRDPLAQMPTKASSASAQGDGAQMPTRPKRLILFDHAGRVLRVRSTDWCPPAYAASPRLLADCTPHWSTPELVFSDAAVKEYIPERDISELLKWRPAENWWDAAPFKITLYVDFRSRKQFVQQILVVSTTNGVAMLGTGPMIGRNGKVIPSAPPPMNAMTIDLVAATNKGLPIAWVVSHIVHELADKQALMRQALVNSIR